jgi:hypothetical protein
MALIGPPDPRTLEPWATITSTLFRPPERLAGRRGYAVRGGCRHADPSSQIVRVARGDRNDLRLCIQGEGKGFFVERTHLVVHREGTSGSHIPSVCSLTSSADRNEFAKLPRPPSETAAFGRRLRPDRGLNHRILDAEKLAQTGTQHALPPSLPVTGEA